MTDTLPEVMAIPVRRDRPFDPPPEYARLRERRPVSRLRLPGGRIGWLVTRHKDIRALLSDPRLLPPLVQVTPAAELPLPDEELKVPPGTFAALDPPEHTRYRKLVASRFTPKAVKQIRPRIEEIVDEHLSRMIEAGPPSDLAGGFARPIALSMVSELLGVPVRERAAFQESVRTMFSLQSSTERLRAAREQMYRGLTGLVSFRHIEPGGDLLSELVHGGELTDEEIVNIGALLLMAGLETSSHMIALGTFALLEHPEQLALLRADPERIRRAVEELLRYLTIVQFGLTRTTLVDMEIAGQPIRAGETVIASLAAANRDDQVFTEPDRLDLHRDEAPHLAFGHGVHHCLGAHLARAELEIAFGTLLHRLPTLRLAVPAEEVSRGEDTVFYGLHTLPVTW